MEGNESSFLSSTNVSRPTLYTSIVSNGGAQSQIVNNNKEQLTGVTQSHAIVIDPLDGVTGHQYSKAVAEVVGNKTVTHVGRKSGKVILYLKDTSFVTQVITSGIGVAGQHVKVTPLTLQSKRVVISNVNPDIPNQLIRSYLKRYGEISTSVFPLSAGFKDELSHVLSLRRACRMFLKDEYQQLDTFFDFPYNGQNHRVFVAVDGLMCFYCKKRNHIRANCPELQKEEVKLTPDPRTERPSTSTDDGFTTVHYKKGPKDKQRLKTMQASANIIVEATHEDISNDVTTNDNSTDNDNTKDDNKTGGKSTENIHMTDTTTTTTTDLTTDMTTDTSTKATQQDTSNKDVNLTKCETTSNTTQGLKQKHRFDYDKKQLVSEHIHKSVETKTSNLPTANLPTANLLTTVIRTTDITESDESDGTGNPLTPVSERESRSHSHSPGERKKRRVSLEGFVEDLDMKVDPHGDPGPPVSEAARFYLRSDSMTSLSSVSSWSSINSEDVMFTEESKLENDLLPTQKERQEVLSFIISVKKKKNIESRVETAFPNIRRFLDICDSLLTEGGLENKLKNRIKRIVSTLSAHLKNKSLR